MIGEALTTLDPAAARCLVERIVEEKNCDTEGLVVCVFEHLGESCDLSTLQWFCEKFKLTILDLQDPLAFMHYAVNGFAKICILYQFDKARWLFTHFKMEEFAGDYEISIESLLKLLKRGDSDSQQMAEWIAEQLNL